MEETNKKHSDEPKTEIKPNDIVKPDFIMTLLLSEREGIRKKKGRKEGRTGAEENLLSVEPFIIGRMVQIDCHRSWQCTVYYLHPNWTSTADMVFEHGRARRRMNQLSNIRMYT